ncbi:MAG: RnfABCDGE type electron transport complex subunit D [bacterium]|nr:RnfABCDGE type electron transport complex subunit D [bacterium]
MKLVVSVSPHIHRDISIPRIIYTVIIALVPAFIWSIYSFGIRALWLVIVSCGVACLTEAIVQILIKKRRTYFDGSAILTGMLLAFNLPVKVPLWIPIVGVIFAIVVAKQAFGGLGYNFINPALAGRAFIVASWPQAMSSLWSAPKFGAISDMNVITNVAPLGVLKMNSGNPAIVSMLNSGESIKNLFLGVYGGTLGEISCLFLLLGGIFLIAMKYIDWRIPLSYIGTVGILMQLFYMFGITPVNGIFHILAGGLFLGAFFMATDYVTSPITREGRWVFGVGCGVITVLIRLWGAQPEGVCFAILIMNCFVPLIERALKPKIFKQIKILS